MSVNLAGLMGDTVSDTPKAKPKSQAGLGINVSKLLAEIETFQPGEEIVKKKRQKKGGKRKEAKISSNQIKQVENWMETLDDSDQYKNAEMYDGYYLEYLKKLRCHEKLYVYVVRHHNEVHIFREKRKASDYSEWAERDLEIIRSEEYFWMVHPGMVLIAHDMTHRQLVIQPNGSVLVKLRPRRRCDSVMPMRYTANEIIALRDRFNQTFRPNFHSLARNPELVTYVLNALGIQRSPREEEKFLQTLSNVFNMDEFAAMGSNISDVEPIQDYLVSDGMRNRLRPDGTRQLVRTTGSHKGRVTNRMALTVKVEGPPVRERTGSKIYAFRDTPDVTFPFIRDYGTFENVTCKAHYNALRSRSE